MTSYQNSTAMLFLDFDGLLQSSFSRRCQAHTTEMLARSRRTGVLAIFRRDCQRGRDRLR